MQTTWIVAADSTRARIFQAEGAGQNFHELEDLVNEAARAQDRELTSDARGRFRGKGYGQQGHTSEPDADQPRHETELFAKRVCEYLDKGRVEHKYDELFLVADPKFLGLTRSMMCKEVQQMVHRELPKDISWLDEREIAEFYRNNRLPDS